LTGQSRRFIFKFFCDILGLLKAVALPAHSTGADIPSGIGEKQIMVLDPNQAECSHGKK
jgi:hypothetical protein